MGLLVARRELAATAGSAAAVPPGDAVARADGAVARAGIEVGRAGAEVAEGELVDGAGVHRVHAYVLGPSWAERARGVEAYVATLRGGRGAETVSFLL